MIEFLQWLFGKRAPEAVLGALPDSRDLEARERDYTFREIVAEAEDVKWVEKESYRRSIITDQNGSGSCVAHSVAKILAYALWLRNGKKQFVLPSATHIYQRRANRPEPGMQGVDALDIARKGTTLEDFVPSQKMTDAQMDAALVEKFEKDIGEVLKLDNYILLPTRDIDAIASVIQKTEKAVMVWFYFKSEEWKRVAPVVRSPSLDLYGYSTLRHSVVAVDFTLYKGKKALVIEESWGSESGDQGQRIITEDFFKARNWFAAYPMRFAFEPQNVSTKPFYDGSVRSLQDCLKAEGVFPTNVESTGILGAITEKGIREFQKKYGIEQTGTVGPKTTAKLKALYS